MANVKCEQLNDCKILICSGCMSTERVLTPLKENEHVFHVICHDFVFQSQVLLCWECMAVLRRVRKFQKQVDNAQRALHVYFMEQNEPPKCLSNLAFNTETLCVTNTNDTDDKDLIVVKKEIEEYKEDIECLEDICNVIEDVVPDVKEEVIEAPEIKREKPPVKLTKHYQFILENNENHMERVSVSQDELTEHLEGVRQSAEFMNLKYKCEHCVCGWSTEKRKKQHDNKYHKKPGPYACDICTRRFVNRQSMTLHIRGHYSLLRCSQCGLTSHVRRDMQRHLYTHKKTVQCLYCQCTFSSLKLYRKHCKALHKTFCCDYCGRKSGTKRALEKHIRHHADTHKCAMCAKVFKSSLRLRRHVTLMHSVSRDENSYCVLCDKQFNNKEMYKRHVRSSAAHAQERKKKVKEKVSCPDCGNLYSRKTYMMNHYRYVHMNQSKYYCGDCDKSFLNRTRYVEHMRYRHEGVTKQKNKLCNVCGRGFAETRTLVNHIRTHSGERPHECTYCEAKFIQKYAMLMHIKHVHLKFKRRSAWHET